MNRRKKLIDFSLSKRQRFIIVVGILSLGLLFSEHLLGKSGFFVCFILAIFTDILLFWSNKKEIKENFYLPLFILPFFYSLSFGLFYFLIPARFLTRIASTLLYSLGLYSLFLAQNIFTVATIRTIALLSSARTVSFIITLISYFFLSNIVFSFHINILVTLIMLSIFSFFLILQSLWTITLEKSLRLYSLWALALTVCLLEVSLVLWFWPSSPTIIAIFLTGFFYTIVGPSQVWLDRRLFRGVMWEFLWVAVVVFSIFILFTSWRG